MRLGRALYPLTIVGLLLLLFVHVQPILLPFALAAALAYLANPLVRRIKRAGLRHELAAAVVFAALLACAAAVAYFALELVVRHSGSVAENLPDYLGRVEDVANEGLNWLRRWEPGQALGVTEWLQGEHEWVLLDFGMILGHPLQHVLPLAEAALLVPFLTYFFLLEGPRWWDEALRLAPAAHVEMLLNVLLELEYAFGGYLRGLLLQALFMGGLAGLGFWLMGLMYAWRIAAWVALTSLIPFVGPTSAAIAGGVVALFQWGTLAGLLKVLAVYLAIRLVDDWFFHPYVMRKAVHLHPVVTIFSLMAGAFLFGFWGLIFAIPVVCAAKVLLEVTWRHYQVACGIHHRSSPFALTEPLI